MGLTSAVYNHLRVFSKEAAEDRPTLGNVHIKDEQCYCADGYVLYQFPLARIDKAEWLREHCETWDNEQAWSRYLRVDDSGNEVYAVDIIKDTLPCGAALPSVGKAYPNVSVITDNSWVEAGLISTAGIWSLCYTQQSAFAKAGKSAYIMRLPNCPANLLGEFVEYALKFPFFLIADELLTLSYASAKEDASMFMIKLASKDASCIIMNHLGDIDPTKD